MRTFRRPVLAAVAVAATAFGLFSSSTAAFAGTTTSKGYSVQMQEIATTCPGPGASAIGKGCVAWTITLTHLVPIVGPGSTTISVSAYDALVIDAAGNLDTVLFAAGGATAGTFSTKGKTTKAKFTVPMNCISPPCALGGNTVFNLTFSLGKGSSFESHSEIDVSESTTCVITNTDTESLLGLPKVAGTVKVGGTTKSVHRFVKDLSSKVYVATQVHKTVAKPDCF